MQACGRHGGGHPGTHQVPLALNIPNVLLALAAVGKACCKGSHIGLHAIVCLQHVCKLRMFCQQAAMAVESPFSFLYEQAAAN